MKVLLSIKPEFALKIFNGSKKYEYRRIIFRREQVTKVVVYASAPIGEVIGEFEIADILHDEPKRLWVKTNQHAGINREKFFEYFSNRTKGYAIKVKSYAKYCSPKSLHSFRITTPPQSFMYLE